VICLVSKVVECVLECCLIMIIFEFEEKYWYVFDNIIGDGNISGVY